MRTLGLLLLALFVFTMPSLAQSVDGVWEGEVQGRNGMQAVTFNLKADGAKLTGKVSTRRGDVDIEDGKIDGDQISFKTTLSFGGNTATMVYTGKVSGDEIAFKRVIEEFDRTSEFTAKRKT